MSLVWLNGRFVHRDAAQISVDDRGFLLGDGAFETMRFEAGQIRHWEQHKARLAGGLNWLDIAQPDFDALSGIAQALVSRHQLEAAVVRLTISRGPGGGGLVSPSDIRPTVLMSARAMPEPRQDGLDLITVPEAQRAGLASERFKLSQYGEPQRARRQALAQGGDMGVLLNAQDQSLVCADCANLFWMKDGAVFTPPVSAGALPGTCRARVMASCADQGIEVGEIRAHADHVGAADAVFVTNAVMGVVPVRQLDAKPVKQSADLLEAFKALA